MGAYCKNIICIILIAVQLLLVAIPIGLCLQKTVVQWEMKEKMEHASLQTLKVKAGEIQWHHFEKECRIAGRMFDVKSVEKAGDWLILEGLYDDEETAIELALENTTPSADDEKRSASIFACISVLAMPNSLEGISKLPPVHNGEWWLNVNCTILSTPPTVNTPPPETSC